MKRHRSVSRTGKAQQTLKTKRGTASNPARNRRLSALSKNTDVARLARELDEALEQQTATSEILQRHQQIAQRYAAGIRRHRTEWVEAVPRSHDPGASWHIVTTRDVNGDGKADLIWQNTDGTP